VFLVTDEERSSASTERFAKKNVEARGLFALEHHRWGRSGDSYSYQPGADLVASFGITPGLSGASWSAQETGALHLSRIGSPKAATFGELDPVACSEMFRDLALLTAL
jgi:hypothetical protein